MNNDAQQQDQNVPNPSINDNPQQTPTQQPTAPFGPNAPMPPRKSRTKLFVAVVFVTVLLLIGALLYFVVFKKSDTKTTASTKNTETAAQKPVALSPSNLYYQLGNEIASYNPKTNEKGTLTSSIPREARVLDLYASESEWRAYYSKAVSNSESTQVFYIDSTSAKPKSVLEINQFGIIEANAKHKMIAYTLPYVAKQNPTPEEQTTRQYILKDGKTTLVAQSTANNHDEPGTSLKNANIATTAISPDGTRILYTNIGKYYSEGYPNGVIEYDISTKASNVLQEHGDGSYAPDGSVITDVSSFGYDAPTLQDTSVLLRINSGQNTPFNPLLTLKQYGLWSVAYQKGSANYFAVETHDGKNPAQTEGSFDGYYKKGASATEYTKISVKNLPSDNFVVSQIAAEPEHAYNNCYAVMLNARPDYTKPEQLISYGMGMICGTQDTGYSYTDIYSATFKASEGYRVYSLL